MKRFLLTTLTGIVLVMSGWAEEAYRYSQDMMPKYRMYVGGSFTLEGVQASRVPQTISEAVSMLPDIPALEQVTTPEAKEKAIRATYQPYKMALEQTMLVAVKKSAGIKSRIDQAHQKQAKQGQQAMQQYQSNVNAGLMPSQQEMMELYMSGEINERMSDEQMMDVMAGKFAAKWGVSKQEYLKIIGLASQNPKQAESYLKSNHPDLYKRLYSANAGYDAHEGFEDPRDKQFSDITEELNALMQQMQDAVGNYGSMDLRNGSTLQGRYNKLFDQLVAEWPESAESKQIDAIEDALQKRVDAWIATLPPNSDDVPYPSWWEAEQKKVNGLIDQWNRRGAEKWLRIARDGQDKYVAIFKRVAELEQENEALNKQGEPENLFYLENLNQLNVLYGMLAQLLMPMQDAFEFPCIKHVETSGSVYFGKG